MEAPIIEPANATLHLHRGAEQRDAYHKRTALPVRCKRLLGVRPGTASRVASPCPQGVWGGHTMQRRRPLCPRVVWAGVVLDALRLGCLSSWMLPSWVSWPRRGAPWTDLPWSWGSLAPLAPNVAAPNCHSTTRVALLRTDAGRVRPSARAALRLMMSSGCLTVSTGRSPGLAPLRILSTYPAALRVDSANEVP
jgi:hypothetical protein